MKNQISSSILTACLGGLLVPNSASAVSAAIGPDDIQRLSHIVTDDAGTGPSYHYRYTVVNDSPAPQWTSIEGTSVQVWPLIIGYEIPLDDPSFVANVTSPETWNHRFLSNAEYIEQYGSNPFNSAWVLQWYDRDFPANKTIAPNGYNATFEASDYEPSASGFGFDSTLAPTDGPYANLWSDAFRNIGDPPLPGGNTGGGSLPYTPLNSVPDCGTTLSLLGFAFVGLTLLSRRVRG